MPKTIQIILLGILYLFSLLSSLNKIEIRGPEPKRAIVSLEMLISENYITPTIHGEPYYNKPPFFNWVQAGFFKLTGNYDETICRLPGILSLILTGVLLFYFSKKMFDKSTAFVATLILYTSGDLYMYGSVYSGGMDLFLSLITFLQIGSAIYFYYKSKYFSVFIFSYLFSAIGFLTKGLPSIVIQVVSILLIFTLNRNWKYLLTTRHLAGILTFLIPVGIYFYAFTRENNFNLFLMNLFSESLSRYDSSQGFLAIFSQLLNLLPRLLINLLIPWSLIFLLITKKNIRKKVWRLKNFKLIMWITILNSLIFFLAPDYHNRYLYPFLPFMALILSVIYNSDERINNSNAIQIGMRILLLFLGLGSVLIIFLPIFKNVDSLVVKGSVFALIFISLFYMQRKSITKPVILIGLMLVIFRIGVNYIYLPSIQNTGKIKYRSISEKILEITNNERIYLTGDIDKIPISVNIGNIQLLKTNDIIEVPPVIPYQIPYYLTRATGQIMAYQQNLIQGNYYLIRSIELNQQEYQELFKFNDNFWGYDLVLFQHLANDTNFD